MLKKSITYKNVFTDESVTEVFYFNLSEADMVELEVSQERGLSDTLTKIMQSQDMEAIYSVFKKIVLKAYGKKGEDGKSFIKNQQLRDEFESSNAYSALLMEMMSEEGEFDRFITAVIPKGMLDDQNQLKLVPPDKVNTSVAPTPKKLTIAELADIDADDLKTGLATGRYTL